MTLDETKQKILSDNAFILSELERIQVLFRMKQVIRYHHVREEELDTESVAEHVYGMLVLMDYFWTLEEVTNERWDYRRAVQLALYHDIDEILTGDTIGYMKTSVDREKEFIAQQEIVGLLSPFSQPHVRSVLEEYERQETVESRFVKAIDKIEPLFHLINENGKRICLRNKATHTQSRSIKDKYVSAFPCIKRFNEVLNRYMLANGFFTPEA